MLMSDDIVIVATSQEELQGLVSRVEKYNVITNAAKTKIMTNTSKTYAVLVVGGKLKEAYLFGYSGSRIANDDFLREGRKV